jgi:hypothetical protein
VHLLGRSEDRSFVIVPAGDGRGSRQFRPGLDVPPRRVERRDLGTFHNTVLQTYRQVGSSEETPGFQIVKPQTSCITGQ